MIPVVLDRQGYAGKIDLTANLPRGLRLEGSQIAEGASGVLVTIERGNGPFEPFITALQGKNEHDIEQTVLLKGHPLERLQPWLAAEIAVVPSSVTAKDFTVDWGELPKDAALYLAGKLVLPVKAVRADPNTIVKISLLTSQVFDAKPDPKRSLRLEKAVELAANTENGEVTILVPAELPALFYDVTVKAELFAADKKTVLATTFLPVRRLPVLPPLTVHLKGTNRIETTIDSERGERSGSRETSGCVRG